MWAIIDIGSATVAGLLPILVGVLAVCLGALFAAFAGRPPAANGWEPQQRRPAGWAHRLAKAARATARTWACARAAEKRAARCNARAAVLRAQRAARPTFAPNGRAPSPRPATLARTSGLWAIGEDFLEFLVPDGHWVEV